MRGPERDARLPQPARGHRRGLHRQTASSAPGDLAVRSADGFIRLVGRRATDLIKSGGFKIGAGEIESALLDHPAVAEAAVAGVPDADLGERVCAWVVLRPDAARDRPRADRSRGRGALATQAPAQVWMVDSLPRNAMGKVLKTELRAQATVSELPIAQSSASASWSR